MGLATMARIDPEQLRRVIEQRRASRPEGTTSPNRASGAMAAVRENLAALRALQTAGFTWDEIAAALSARGVLRRDGQPLTGRRLTALIDSVERQMRGELRRAEMRRARSDLVRPAQAALTRLPVRTEDPSLMPHPLRAEPDTAADEEAIRRENLARIQDLLMPPTSPPSRKD